MIFQKISSDNDYGNNYVIGCPSTFIDSQLKIEGENNNIIFGKNFNGRKLHIYVVGDHCTVIFGANCEIYGKIWVYNRGSITIGNNFKATTDVHLTAFHHCALTIGDGCLFSNVYAETTDHHTIFDKDTKKQVNQGKNIIVGDRVWCARDVIIAKGAVIGNDVVVGARSFVHGEIGNNVVVAGSPAKVIRENVVWAEIPELKELPKVLGTAKMS